ncbi:MAG: hypothetical protein H8F28_03890 [Fibrella sp.]|nr:hypothetical protein [Armatimonadota bacterium]
MSIVITEVVRLVGYVKVFFRLPSGNIGAGVWMGESPRVHCEYSVEYDVRDAVRWGRELRPAETGTSPSVRLNGDTVILTGEFVHMPLPDETLNVVAYHDSLRYEDNVCAVRLTVEGETPDRMEAAELSIPFYRLGMWPYFT